MKQIIKVKEEVVDGTIKYTAKGVGADGINYGTTYTIPKQAKHSKGDSVTNNEGLFMVARTLTAINQLPKGVTFEQFMVDTQSYPRVHLNLKDFNIEIV